MRISWDDLRTSTPGGSFANAHYLNSIQMAMGTQTVPASPPYILQP